MASIVTSLLSGFFGAKAAKNAGNVAAGGYNDAGNTVTQGATNANQVIHDAGQTAGNNSLASGITAGQGVTVAGQTSGQNAIQAGGDAGNLVTSTANSGSGRVSDSGVNANNRLQSYMSGGSQANDQLAEYLSPGGAGQKSFTGVDLQNDPGYQFRLQQGQIALDRSAAARGGALGGGAVRATTDYQQGAASDEFSRAFDRFRTNRQDNVANLSGLANRGLTAADAAGRNDIQTSEYGAGLQSDAARQSGIFNTQASQYAGDKSYNAATYTGDTLMRGTQEQGIFNTNAASQEGVNTMRASEYKGDTQIGASGAKAHGIIGAQDSWNTALSGIGGGIDSAITGGLSGGGSGFNWRAALGGKK